MVTLQVCIGKGYKRANLPERCTDELPSLLASLERPILSLPCQPDWWILSLPRHFKHSIVLGNENR